MVDPGQYSKSLKILMSLKRDSFIHRLVPQGYHRVKKHEFIWKFVLSIIFFNRIVRSPFKKRWIVENRILPMLFEWTSDDMIEESYEQNKFPNEFMFF